MGAFSHHILRGKYDLRPIICATVPILRLRSRVEVLEASARFETLVASNFVDGFLVIKVSQSPPHYTFVISCLVLVGATLAAVFFAGGLTMSFRLIHANYSTGLCRT